MTADKWRLTGSTRTITTYSESRRLYVFEVPETASFPGTQQDTFSTGNFSRWTATAGQFARGAIGRHSRAAPVEPGGRRRERISRLSTGRTNPSKPTCGPWSSPVLGRWFGLVTRRTDAQNYYYVTFRSPNVISLRRMRDGVYTELASTTGIREFPDGSQLPHASRIRRRPARRVHRRHSACCTSRTAL